MPARVLACVEPFWSPAYQGCLQSPWPSSRGRLTWGGRCRWERSCSSQRQQCPSMYLASLYSIVEFEQDILILINRYSHQGSKIGLMTDLRKFPLRRRKRWSKVRRADPILPFLWCHHEISSSRSQSLPRHWAPHHSWQVGRILFTYCIFLALLGWDTTIL